MLQFVLLSSMKRSVLSVINLSISNTLHFSYPVSIYNINILPILTLFREAVICTIKITTLNITDHVIWRSKRILFLTPSSSLCIFTVYPQLETKGKALLRSQ